jgi:predicted enzyme related to lactoylglutathione lyase
MTTVPGVSARRHGLIPIHIDGAQNLGDRNRTGCAINVSSRRVGVARWVPAIFLHCSSLLEHTARRILAKRRNTISELESSMNQVQVEQESYQMPPQDGFTVAHFLTVADIERSARFYETVFGGRILSRGDSSGAPGYIQIANTWLIVNVGGGPTPDKPSVTLGVPADPDSLSSFMNIRVADIQACYELWRNRGAEFITEPKDKRGETRCYIRDPDGYIIEVGQSKPGFTYGKRHDT